MSENFPRATLIFGGAASGKSRYAEQLVNASGRDRVYIATAQAFDEEMKTKIARHKARRGEGWEVLEKPFAMPDAIKTIPADKVILVDCLTIWLSNYMLAKMPVEELADQLLKGLSEARAPVVMVSNETGQSVVPESELGRQFRQAQGELNQAVANYSDLVVNVMAGLPLVLKGHLPHSDT